MPPGRSGAGGWGAFPDWIYESTDAEYLSRIFFPEGVTTAARRLAIRAGLTAAARAQRRLHVDAT